MTSKLFLSVNLFVDRPQIRIGEECLFVGDGAPVGEPDLDVAASPVQFTCRGVERYKSLHMSFDVVYCNTELVVSPLYMDDGWIECVHDHTKR
jgi:hypothetical protein